MATYVLHACEICRGQEETCPKVSATTSSWNLKLQWSKQSHTYAWGFLVCFGFPNVGSVEFSLEKTLHMPNFFWENGIIFSLLTCPHPAQSQFSYPMHIPSKPAHQQQGMFALPPLFQYTKYSSEEWLAMLSVAPKLVPWRMQKQFYNFFLLQKD